MKNLFCLAARKARLLALLLPLQLSYLSHNNHSVKTAAAAGFTNNTARKAKLLALLPPLWLAYLLHNHSVETAADAGFTSKGLCVTRTHY